MNYFLGVDTGGTKTHALISDEEGNAVGFGQAGPGNWEVVGYDGLTDNLLTSVSQAVSQAGITVAQLKGAGMGLAGYDWPSQRDLHLNAIAPLNLTCPLEILNDSCLGIPAGTTAGWGISVVSGTGCNCRGWRKDHLREGRVVGGAGIWSGEAAGGYDILSRAMRAVAFEWSQRGPATALSPAFIKFTNVKNLDELIEKLYLAQIAPSPEMVMLVFDIARQGDLEAVEVIRWAGNELGMLATSVIHQLDLMKEAFEVVLIGSIFDGHPLIMEKMQTTILSHAPHARLVRLSTPPVVGAVLLGLQAAGCETIPIQPKLIHSTKKLLASLEDSN